MHKSTNMENSGKTKFGTLVPKGYRSFTLVELMVVVAVIGIIAGIVMAAAGGVQKKAARDQARAEIKSMLVGLERYRGERGEYPPPGQQNPSSTALYTNLTNYMTFRTNQISGQQVLDPYGYPYWYRLVTNSSSSGAATSSMMSEAVEVWSVGANGKSGYTNSTPNRTDSNNGDDITSW
ncbi:MAG: prepilin-type N-terminal cleavage/methylation domain-containing protein [Verrucomicrobia bacterium]|nr:prepilin-type N-terminal cleavage/methylation domain-containing protein [Verrucomicrobiota bacterium]